MSAKECCGEGCGNCDDVLGNEIMEDMRAEDIAQSEIDCMLLSNALRDLNNIIGADIDFSFHYKFVENLVNKYSR
jgi:hypothetical protein